MAYEPGTLVRVRDSALGDYLNDLNDSYVREYGYLYIIETLASPMANEEQGYWCRSIATGDSGLFWEEGEIEGADNHE